MQKNYQYIYTFTSTLGVNREPAGAEIIASQKMRHGQVNHLTVPHQGRINSIIVINVSSQLFSFIYRFLRSKKSSSNISIKRDIRYKNIRKHIECLLSNFIRPVSLFSILSRSDIIKRPVWLATRDSRQLDVGNSCDVHNKMNNEPTKARLREIVISAPQTRVRQGDDSWRHRSFHRLR